MIYRDYISRSLSDAERWLDDRERDGWTCVLLSSVAGYWLATVKRRVR